MSIQEIKTELKRKWTVLYQAKRLGADQKSLIAIRNKIYEDQDKLVEAMIENKVESKSSDFWIKNRDELTEEQIKQLEKYYERVTSNIEELSEEAEI